MAVIDYSRLFFFAALRLGVRSFRINRIATRPLAAQQALTLLDPARTCKTNLTQSRKDAKNTRTIRSSRWPQSAICAFSFCGFAAWRDILRFGTVGF